MSDKKTRRSFSFAQKLEIIREADATTPTAAAEKYGVQVNQIYRWRKLLAHRRTLRAKRAEPSPSATVPAFAERSSRSDADYIAHLEAMLAAQLVELERLRFRR